MSTLIKNKVIINMSSTVKSDFNDGECAICLSPCINKSRPACDHYFCYRCLVDWCQRKLDCPVCRKPFTSFIHSIKSPEEYQTHRPDPVVSPIASMNYEDVWNVFLSIRELRTLLNSLREVIGRDPEGLRRFRDLHQGLITMTLPLPAIDNGELDVRINRFATQNALYRNILISLIAYVIQ